MKVTIKIHDTQWFKEHCRVCDRVKEFDGLKPNYDSWLPIRTIHWLRGPGCMGPLEGKVLEVEHDSGNDSGLMYNARYMAAGFWIPNWAIEWIKEEQEFQQWSAEQYNDYLRGEA